MLYPADVEREEKLLFSSSVERLQSKKILGRFQDSRVEEVAQWSESPKRGISQMLWEDICSMFASVCVIFLSENGKPPEIVPN